MRGPQLLTQMNSLFLLPQAQHLPFFNPSPIPENTWKEVNTLRLLAGSGGLTVTSSLGACVAEGRGEMQIQALKGEELREEGGGRHPAFFRTMVPAGAGEA